MIAKALALLFAGVFLGGGILAVGEAPGSLFEILVALLLGGGGLGTLVVWLVRRGAEQADEREKAWDTRLTAVLEAHDVRLATVLQAARDEREKDRSHDREERAATAALHAHQVAELLKRLGNPGV